MSNVFVPHAPTMSRVCSACFEDEDLRALIRDSGGPRGCDFCGRKDAVTATVEHVCKRIRQSIEKFWGRAVDQLTYVSREGGYQGTTWDTWDVLFEELDLSLPRDNSNRLAHALINELPDELWCDYDCGALDDDVALRSSWQEFCENVKHSRRFFFHGLGGSDDDRDSYSAAALLDAIAHLSEGIGFVGVLPAGTLLWRARGDIAPNKRTSAQDFGPPPKEYALQSNRMNPPGIPMMYAASSALTAMREARAAAARVGRWRTLRDARIMDLRNLPATPGPFSTASRRGTLATKFLKHFADEIMTPVARDDRVHIEYLPSQVVTEYLRDFQFEAGRLDGIAYPSTVDPRGWNLAMFVDPVDLGLRQERYASHREPWLAFEGAVRRQQVQT